MLTRTPVRRLSIVLILSAFVFALFLGSTGFTSASAEENDRNIKGEFHTQSFGGPTCTSPVGLCSAGTITGGISGTVAVVIQTVQIKTEKSGKQVELYTATINVTTSKGNFSGTVNGVISLTTGDLRSVVRLTQGTDRYAKAKAVLDVNGNFNLATGAENDSYTGEIERR